MNTPTAEKLAEIHQNTASEANRSEVAILPWSLVDEQVQAAHIAGMKAVLDVYHASFGEGMPTVDEIESVNAEARAKSENGYNAVRNLMLAAHGKQMAEKDAEVERLESMNTTQKQTIREYRDENRALKNKMVAIAKLQEKWWNDNNSGLSVINVCGCAYELSSALGSSPVAEPATSSPISALVEALVADPEYAWSWHCNIAMAVYDAELDKQDERKSYFACNAGAAKFLSRLTDGKVDTTKHPAYAQKKNIDLVPDAPADKWVKEKEAHARGEKIEVLPEGYKDWQECVMPSWSEYCEYRIAPGQPQPVQPAGKLTDEQLGEIGVDAAFVAMGNKQSMIVDRRCGLWEKIGPGRTAFASAVRKAFEAETPWGANGESQEEWVNKQCDAKYKEMLDTKMKWLTSCEKGDAEMFSIQSNTELAEGLRGMRIHVGSAFHGILNASVLRLESNAATMERLEAENAALEERNDLQAFTFQRLEKLLKLPSHLQSSTEPLFDAIKAIQAELDRLREALKSAAAVIGQKIEGQLLHVYMAQQFPITKGHVPLQKYYQSLGSELVNIASVLPAPDPEEASHNKFEAWITETFPGYGLQKTDTGEYKDHNTRVAQAAWQAARKEVKP